VPGCARSKRSGLKPYPGQDDTEKFIPRLNYPRALVGNKGYRRYLRLTRDHITIDQEKRDADQRFDGKGVLRTTTDLSPGQVALKYKELRQVEHAFRDIKSALETRAGFHQRDETIRGHVFCSFFALVLREDLYQRLEANGYRFECSDINEDLKSLQEIVIEDNGKSLAIRGECLGTCGKVFQSVGVAIPPTIREI
jgi:transposase